MKKFEIGKEYITRFIGDSQSILIFSIIKRTAEFITFKEIDDDKIIRRKVYIYDDAENCHPFGIYSLSPVLSANRENTIKDYKEKNDLYIEKKENKIKRFEEKAKNAIIDSDNAFKSAHSMASIIPFGQPILRCIFTSRFNFRYFF